MPLHVLPVVKGAPSATYVYAKAKEDPSLFLFLWGWKENNRCIIFFFERSDGGNGGVYNYLNTYLLRASKSATRVSDSAMIYSCPLGNFFCLLFSNVFEELGASLFPGKNYSFGTFKSASSLSFGHDGLSPRGTLH